MSTLVEHLKCFLSFLQVSQLFFNHDPLLNLFPSCAPTPQLNLWSQVTDPIMCSSLVAHSNI